MRNLLPWSDWRAHALDQTCVSESAGLHKQTYRVWCTTSLTTYAGFTGDLAAEILNTDETMAAAGWCDLGPTTCGPANWSLTHRWLAAGHQLLPSDELPPSSPLARALYWDVAPLDHDAVRADILARHQYVVVVSLSLTCTYPLEN